MQDVKGLEPKRLHSEEVAGQDGPGLGAQEGSPRETAPAWGRWHTALPEDRPDGCAGDRVAQLEHLAPDALVSPARILPGEPEDQLAAVGRERWTAWVAAPAESSPFPSDKLPMPPQQGLRTYREAAATGSRQTTAQGSEDQAVAGTLGRALGLAPQDADCVP